MAKKIFAQDVDFNKNEMLQARAENLLTFPDVANIDSGYIFYHTANKRFYGWDGTDWLELSGGGGGASSFLGLSDTPSSYSGQEGKSIVVNSGGTGLEFSNASGGGISDISGGYGVTIDKNNPSVPIVSLTLDSGTFSPVIQGYSPTGQIGYTYTQSLGNGIWKRFGNLVYITIDIRGINTSGNTDSNVTTSISPLPITSGGLTPLGLHTLTGFQFSNQVVQVLVSATVNRVSFAWNNSSSPFGMPIAISPEVPIVNGRLFITGVYPI